MYVYHDQYEETLTGRHGHPSERHDTMCFSKGTLSRAVVGHIGCHLPKSQEAPVEAQMKDEIPCF